jgi:hypothetical protein
MPRETSNSRHLLFRPFYVLCLCQRYCFVGFVLGSGDCQGLSGGYEVSTETTAATPAFEALAEYLELRAELVRLEAQGEKECGCDPNNFHTCDLCKATDARQFQTRRLVELWGDNWAVMLSQFTHARPEPKLMSMERACARKWLEANPTAGHEPFKNLPASYSEAQFEKDVEALALQIFHYMNGYDDSEEK